MSAVTNVVFAGLGGQGVIKASDILADAALRAGLDVKKSELHGMSQRGGSVTSDVRFGRTPRDRVLSPMVPRGEADYLVVLAESEAEVARAMLRRGGVLLSADLIPDAELPNKRSLNVALLGALSLHLDLPAEAILDAMRAALPERLHAVNDRAFELGRRVAAGAAAAAGRLGG
jgi:indolepyruvate ferredoxin oxidoreductase beta subunit